MPRESSSSNRSKGSTSLVMRLKSNDADAWQSLLDLYVPLIFSWCRRAGLQSEDAADVVQEVFRSVARGIGDFTYTRPTGNFRGWLKAITNSRIVDHFRSDKRRPNVIGGTTAHQWLQEIPQVEFDEATNSELTGGLVHRVLGLIRAEFEERTWKAFWLCTVENRTCTDVAEQLAMSPGAVRQAKYKVLRRLRQELGDAE